MSQFEYVSIAVSMVYALVISRLLGSAFAALRAPARYSVHVAWLFTLFLLCAFSWWRLWDIREIDWSGPLFVFAFVSPAILSLQVSALIGDDIEKPHSYRDVFFRNRVPFFAITCIFCVVGFLAPWIYGIASWFSVGPYQRVTLVGLAISAAGIALPAHRAQVAIVTCALIGLVAGFLVPFSNASGG